MIPYVGAERDSAIQHASTFCPVNGAAIGRANHHPTQGMLLDGVVFCHTRSVGSGFFDAKTSGRVVTLARAKIDMVCN